MNLACRASLGGALAAIFASGFVLADAPGAPPAVQASSFYEPASSESPGPPPELGALIHWDPAIGAHAIAEHDYGHSWQRSPDGKRMLLAIHLGAKRTDDEGKPAPEGQPRPRLRRDLSFLTYKESRGRPGASGVAILVVDLATHGVTPVKLPFEVERVPRVVAWGDDQSVLLVGGVKDGVLRNWGRRPDEPAYLVRVALQDGALKQIEIPMTHASDHGAEIDSGSTLADLIQGAGIDFGSTLAARGDLIEVSFWLPQVVGGGGGRLSFTAAEKETRVELSREAELATDEITTPPCMDGEWRPAWLVQGSQPGAAAYWFTPLDDPCARKKPG